MSVHAIINRWAALPFRYGLDCCQFAGEVIEDIAGRNPMAAFAYENRPQAMAIIEEYGSLRAAITATLGEPIPVREARDGDALLVDLRACLPRMAELIGDEIVGVAWRDRCVVRTSTGVTDWPMSRATACWSAESCRAP